MKLPRDTRAPRSAGTSIHGPSSSGEEVHTRQGLRSACRSRRPPSAVVTNTEPRFPPVTSTRPSTRPIECGASRSDHVQIVPSAVTRACRRCWLWRPRAPGLDRHVIGCANAEAVDTAHSGASPRVHAKQRSVRRRVSADAPSLDTRARQGPSAKRCTTTSVGSIAFGHASARARSASSRDAKHVRCPVASSTQAEPEIDRDRRWPAHPVGQEHGAALSARRYRAPARHPPVGRVRHIPPYSVIAVSAGGPPPAKGGMVAALRSDVSSGGTKPRLRSPSVTDVAARALAERELPGEPAAAYVRRRR